MTWQAVLLLATGLLLVLDVAWIELTTQPLGDYPYDEPADHPNLGRT